MNRALIVLSAITILSVAVGCKDEKPSDDPTRTTSAPVVKTVTLYSGRSEALVGPVIEQFQKDTGITVNVKYGSSGELAGTLIEEGARSPADVYWAQDAQTLGILTEKGMLNELPAAILEKSESPYQAPKKDWVATSGRSRVLVYNTQKVKAEDLPKTVEELTGPAWKGRVGWAPENASFQAFVAAMVETKGEEATASWLQGMIANQPVAYPKNTPAVLATGKGEVDVALVNHYYLFQVKAEHGAEFPIANHFFKNGGAESLVNVAGISILKTSKNTEAAQAFVEYLLGESAQRHFAEVTYEFPAAAGVEPSHQLPKMLELDAPKIDVAKLSNLKTTVSLLRAAKALP